MSSTQQFIPTKTPVVERPVLRSFRSSDTAFHAKQSIPALQMRDYDSLDADDSAGRSSRGRLPSGKPNPVDVHVGNRLRLRRTLLGLSQEALGEAVGLTFQQVQKYEHGTNRIGASRLWDLSRALDSPVGFFFDDMDAQTQSASPRNVNGETRDITPGEDDPLSKRETLELMRAYYRIKDESVRHRVYELTKSLAAMQAVGEEQTNASNAS